MNNKYIKQSMDLKSGEYNEWEIINSTSILKDEYKEGTVEMVGSYLNAAKSIYMELKKQKNLENAVVVVRTNSLAIPFLYLCRHTIELAIKAALDDRDIPYGNIHSLIDLIKKAKWNIEIDYDLINMLDLIDEKGMWLRYSKDLKTKKEYIGKPFFINSSNIIKETENLANSLINSHLEKEIFSEEEV